MKKTLNLFIFIPMMVIAVVIMGLVFWTQVKGWVYYEGFWGNDTPQFIHYVNYHFKHPGFPINSWDYFWHNGVPRILDTSYINFFFTRPLVENLGVYLTVKIYPLISLGLFVLIAFFLFIELSGSVLLALGMALSLILGQGLYTALFKAGVVMSAISQVFFPLQFYFLARFHRRGSYYNLYLGAIVSALGFFFHGALMMFMGFFPAFVFVLFSTKAGEFIISKRSIKNAILFGIVTFAVGAIATWPHLLQAAQGGSNSVLIPRIGPTTQIETFQPLVQFTDLGIPIAFLFSLMVLLGSLLFRKKEIVRLSLPFIAVFLYGLFWFVTYNFGLHPLAGILFPGRFYWMFPLTLGAIAAVFLSPLSAISLKKLISLDIPKLALLNLLKVGIFTVIILNLIINLFYGNFVKEITQNKPLPRKDINEMTKTNLKDILNKIDSSDLNWRIWSHIQDFNMQWNLVSDIPLSGGYAYINTKRSRLWDGWFYAVMSRPNWESQEIPRDMAEKQALFFLDWYGIKYARFGLGSGEWDLAPYLYENEHYLDKTISDTKIGLLKLDPELTAGIVNPVISPVIGFIGNDEGYMTFLKDLATLNLNTSRLIPLRLGESPSSRDIQSMKALIIYNYKSQDWDKINRYVQNGGLVWIESGGNAPEREKTRLPEVFPIKTSKYGPLGTDWEPGGDLASKIDFSSLEKLSYKNTPWQISYAPSGAVKSGAKVLLTQKGNPIAVAQKVGKGKVLWTGGNFWYRPEEFRQNGTNEIKLIDAFLKELLGEMPPKRVTAEIVRKTPEKIMVSGTGFSGVVFKESYWPGWEAKIKWQTNDGKRKEANLKIYPAGPEMMYVNLPKDSFGQRTEVFLNYAGDPFNWFAFGVSVLSLLIVIDLMTFKIFIKLFKRLPILSKFSNKKLSLKVNQWWAKEEE